MSILISLTEDRNIATVTHHLSSLLSRHGVGVQTEKECERNSEKDTKHEKERKAEMWSTQKVGETERDVGI